MGPEPDIYERTYEFESSSHCGTVLYGLEQLRQKELLFDIHLKVEGKIFPAHRVVLASCSDYFRAMFTDAMKERCQNEVSLNGITALGLQHVLDYAYTSKLTLTEGNVQSVLGAASHLAILPAIDACADFLSTQLDLTNCVDIANLADTYSLTALGRLVTRYMARQLDKLAFLPDFQRLSSPQLIHLLSSNFPADCTELDVVLAVFSWLNYDLEKRQEAAVSLLEHIHFSHIVGEECTELLQSDDVRQVCDKLVKVRDYLLTMLCWSHLNMNKTHQHIGLINPRGFELTVVNIGGFTSETGLTNALSYLHPSTQTWKTLSSIPHIEQCNYGVAVLDNDVYVVGGCFNQSLQENIHPFGFKYNPRHDSWTAISPMQRERCRFYLAATGGNLFAIGGATDQEESEVVEGFCEQYLVESDEWVETSPIPCHMAQHAGASVGNYIYISGGIDCDFILNWLWCYDTISDIWTRKSPMPVARVDHCMVANDNRLYVAGGCNDDPVHGGRVIVDTVDIYDIDSDQWQTVTHLPTPRYLASMVVMDESLHVIGGFCHAEGEFRRASKKVEHFDLRSYSWQDSTDYPLGIWEHASVTMYVPTCWEDRALEPPCKNDSQCS